MLDLDVFIIQSECAWLLRSPKTIEYNLVDVPFDEWSVWAGVIVQGNKVSIFCDECEEDSDCN